MFDFLRGGSRLVLPEEFWEAAKEGANTPDMSDLSMAAHRWILVTDPRMKALISHDEKPKFTVGFTVNRFTVLKETRKKEACFPIPLEEKYPAHPHAPMKGLLYRAEKETIFSLDKLMENEVQFIRKRVNVHVPYWKQTVTRRAEGVINEGTKHERVVNPLPVDVKREAQLAMLRAFMWVAHPQYWNEMFNGTDGGYYGYKRVRLFEHKLPYLPPPIKYPESVQYYCFTKMEYNDE